MKTRVLVIGSSIVCLLVMSIFVALRMYNRPTKATSAIAQQPLSAEAKKKLDDANAPAAQCCKCKQLRKYEELDAQSKQINIGMTQQEVEKVLGKPDFLDGLNNYCYCTDRASFWVSVPLVVQFDEAKKVKKVSFIEAGE
jgi:hypothetical protein